MQDRRMVITNYVQETAHARFDGHATDDVTSAPKVQRCDLDIVQGPYLHNRA